MTPVMAFDGQNPADQLQGLKSQMLSKMTAKKAGWAGIVHELHRSNWMTALGILYPGGCVEFSKVSGVSPVGCCYIYNIGD